MDQNNRPHSRKKTVSSGTAQVRKGQKINAPGTFGGTQGRRPGNPSDFHAVLSNPNAGNHANYSTQRSSGSGLFGLLRNKSVLALILVVIVALFLLKTCSGGSAYMLQEMTDSADFVAEDADYAAQESEIAGDTSASADQSVAPQAREKRVIPLGSGQDVTTVMVYMCGTDLESQHSMATADLQEMANATLSKNVNLLVCTGGCKKWQNNIVSENVNQIYQVDNGKMRRLVEDFGSKSMVDPSNLTAFIKYCTEEFPANRNILIMWDHGGGSVTGYGYDEKNRNAGSMNLGKFNDALKNANCVFDWIGFDACLMATLETALVCNEYSDYMVASEETEPGTGWYYTNWLNTLSEDPSISTLQLTKTLIDDYVGVCKRSSSRAQVTLSVIDLAELQGTVPESFRSFASSTGNMLKNNDYQQISDARANVRQFSASSKLNQIDLIDFADRINTPEAKALSKALQSCVKYNGSTISKANGVSIYFPYEDLRSMNSAISIYNTLGLDAEYTECIKSFASLESAGQITASSSQATSYGGDLLGSLLGSSSSSSSGSPVGSLLGAFLNSSGASSAGSSLDAATVLSLLSSFSGRAMPEELRWIDTQLIAQNAEKISNNYIDPGHIIVTQKDGKNVLSLTEEEWAKIQTVEVNLFVDDGNGFIDLGRDNTFEWTDNNDLLLEFDGTWLTVDGHAAAYYLESDTENDDGSWTTVGRIPAKLNGELVNLQVVFDDENESGIITGAFPYYDDDETDTVPKGGIAVKVGDEIQLLCDYYTYNDAYEDSYTLGNPFTVGSEGLSLNNMKLSGISNCQVSWRLTDIYGNHYWTPVIEA